MVRDDDVDGNEDREEAPENDGGAALVHKKFSKFGPNHCPTSGFLSTLPIPLSCLLPRDYRKSHLQESCSQLRAGDIEFTGIIQQEA
jgi:hypothetical protein